MEISIKHRFSGEVIFVATIECGEDAPLSLKMGLAVKAALEARANLSWANLSGANLSGADLSWANLSKADLSEADLSEADLSKADLSGANLSWADLSKADLSGANLSEADLSKADLSGANLSKADLSEANLSWANLSWANLSKADLSKANLRYIKHDIWGILLNAIPEVPALRQALLDGKVDGSTYAGSCACLCGTIANAKNCDYREMPGIKPDMDSMAERFFLAIRPGDTPDKSLVAKLALQWVDEFIALIGRADRSKVAS